MSDSNTKVLQNPQSGSLTNKGYFENRRSHTNRHRVVFGSGGVSGGGISPLVNTQFQYIDVGVNIDITPQIHSNREVTLKMVGSFIGLG